MKIKQSIQLFTKKIRVFALGFALVAGGLTYLPAGINPVLGSASAACGTTAPATTFGQVTQTINVATAGTYRVWSRIKAPSTSANSYYFRVDTNACWYNVGDSTAIPVNSWTWVNYDNGTTTTPINVTLTAGTHTLTYTGKEADVQLDKVMLLTDTACVPTSLGDNCAVNDITAPAVSVTAPTAGSTVSGTVNVAANATDTSGISRVEFLVDNALKSTDTTAAYSYAWDTTSVANGAHTVQAKAYDASGNVATSTSVSVTVSNVATPVAVPFKMNAGGPALTTASGVAFSADRYFVGGTAADRGAINVTNTSVPEVYRTERWGMSGYNIPIANGTYNYSLRFAETTGSGCTSVGCRVFSVTAEGAPILTNLDVFQAAGGNNISYVKTGTATVTDGNLTFGFTASVDQPEINGIEISAGTTADTTVPSTPTNVTSTSKTTTSINLGWTASTDNVGVTGYRILRNGVQVGTSTATNYTDSGLVAGTSYSYTVRAADAAGNLSTPSTVYSVAINAAADTTPPTTSITSPASGASVPVGTAVTINATASDNTGVARVEFYANGALRGTDTTAPYSFAWDTTGVTPSTVAWTSKAFDGAGNSTTSTAVSVTVTSVATNTPGDVNGDGRVNAIDLSALISHDGQSYAPADFNKDGTVGAADMAILLSKWTW